jgi:hypothetical protein
MALPIKCGAIKISPVSRAFSEGLSDFASGTVGVFLNQRSADHEFPQMLVELPAFVPMQSEFTHELFETRGPLRLSRNVFEDDRIGEHRELSVCSRQLSA